MSTTPELTTRDVLQQIDRRLTHLEELYLQHAERNDRAHGGLDTKIDSIRAGLSSKIDSVHAGLSSETDRVHTGLDSKIDRNLRWTVGLIVGSWMTTMSAIILK